MKQKIILTQEQMEVLKTMCKEKNLDEKLIDANSSYYANKLRLLEKLGTKGKVQSEVQINIQKNRELALKEQEEFERHLREELEKIKRESVDISKFYGNLPHLLKMIDGKFMNCLFLLGRAGLGKSTIVKTTIGNLFSLGGRITAKRLYEILYENKDGSQVIFFDDTEAMLSDDIVVALLKQALDTSEPRVVSWESTRNDLPPNFEFNGRVVFACNQIPSDAGFQAIMSRSSMYEIDFSYSQILQLMTAIAKKERTVNGMTLPPETRLMLVDYIREHSSPATNNFSLMTQWHIENFFAFSKDKWKELTDELLSAKDDTLEIIEELVRSGMPVEYQVSEFIRKTNKSRRTYFNLKKKFGD